MRFKNQSIATEQDWMALHMICKCINILESEHTYIIRIRCVIIVFRSNQDLRTLLIVATKAFSGVMNVNNYLVNSIPYQLFYLK